MWVPVVAISALFALPIVVNLVLHWPGDFGKYFAYSNSSQAGGHSARQIVRYALWFWWPDTHAPAAVLLLAVLLVNAAALAVALGLSRGGLRRFLLMLLGVNAVSSVAVLAYAAAGIDNLNQYYIAYFYWSAPLLALLVIAAGISQALTFRAAGLLVAAGTVAALVVFALAPGMPTSTHDDDAGLPHAVAALAARAQGREIVLSITHPAWVDTTGFLVQAERTHVRACVNSAYWTFMMTSQFICTPEQAADGVPFRFYSPRAPASTPVILRFGHSDVVAGEPVTDRVTPRGLVTGATGLREGPGGAAPGRQSCAGPGGRRGSRWPPPRRSCATCACPGGQRLAPTAGRSRCRPGTCCTATCCCTAGPPRTCPSTRPSWSSTS